MVRDYELMYIVRPDLDEEALAAAMAGVETVVTGQGGEVVSTTPWGKRRLAYEIDKLRDGHYVILHVRLEPARIKDVERLLAISDTVFRHMITIWVPEPESATRPGDGATAVAAVSPAEATPVVAAEAPAEAAEMADDAESVDADAVVEADVKPDAALVGAGPAGDNDDEEKR